MADVDSQSVAPRRRQRSSRSGSEERQMDKLVTIRFSPEQLAEIDEAASAAGLTRPSYIRERSVKRSKGAIRSTRRPPVERAALAKILGQLGKIGSNLNQVARAVNQNGAEDGEISAAVAEVRAAAIEVMAVMGRQT